MWRPRRVSSPNQSKRAIALELVNHSAIEVILIGGRLFKHSVVAVGTAAVEVVSGIHADTFFMGVTGVHPKTGLPTGDYEEAAVKRALSRASAETFVLASAEKLDAASPYEVIGLEEVTGIITEGGVDEAVVRSYRERGIAITRA